MVRAENVRHADGERRRAAGAAEERVFADALRQSRHRLRVDGKAPAEDCRCGGVGGLADDAGRAIHGEVDAGLKRAGGDHGHDADERFHHIAP